MFFCLSTALFISWIFFKFTAANQTTIEQTRHKLTATTIVLVMPSTGNSLNLVKILLELDTKLCPSFNICHYNKMIN